MKSCYTQLIRKCSLDKPYRKKVSSRSLLKYIQHQRFSLTSHLFSQSPSHQAVMLHSEAQPAPHPSTVPPQHSTWYDIKGPPTTMHPFSGNTVPLRFRWSGLDLHMQSNGHYQPPSYHMAKKKKKHQHEWINEPISKTPLLTSSPKKKNFTEQVSISILNPFLDPAPCAGVYS